MKTVFICLFLISLCVAQTEIVIIHTNNTNGILENCKCPDHAYGALEKRATVIEQIRRTHPHVLVFDSGDIFDIQQDTLLHNYISNAYQTIGYDCWTCGDQDFVEGFEFFRASLLRLPMQLVSSNLVFRHAETPIKFKIIDKAGMRFGITGTISKHCFRYVAESVKNSVYLIDQVAGIREVLPELLKQSDYQILLSHSGYEQDMILAGTFPEFDLIIGGHSQTILEKPEKVGQTMIVQAGESGYRVGVLSVKVKAKEITATDYDLVLLDNLVKDDSGMMKIINDYHQKKQNRINKKEKI